MRLNGLFNFCTPWNCPKIIDFLMVFGEGQSLTGLLELVWQIFLFVCLFCRYLLVKNFLTPGKPT